MTWVRGIAQWTSLASPRLCLVPSTGVEGLCSPGGKSLTQHLEEAGVYKGGEDLILELANMDLYEFREGHRQGLWL